jgi:hypothetical protein
VVVVLRAVAIVVTPEMQAVRTARTAAVAAMVAIVNVAWVVVAKARQRAWMAWQRVRPLCRISNSFAEFFSQQLLAESLISSGLNPVNGCYRVIQKKASSPGQISISG